MFSAEEKTKLLRGGANFFHSRNIGHAGPRLARPIDNRPQLTKLSHNYGSRGLQMKG